MGAKRDLYTFIGNLKKQHSLHELPQDYSQNLCRDVFNIQIGQMPIITSGLRGMALPSTNDKPAVIILNSARTQTEQNFDCMHEAVHILRHASEKKVSFSCYDEVRPKQNPFLEWEANEGAAEFIMPYKYFIPMVVGRISFIEGDALRIPPEEISILEEAFSVTYQMVENRIQNLKYEIFQYLSGVPMDLLEIKSLREQKRAGIKYSDFRINSSFGIRRFENYPSTGYYI